MNELSEIKLVRKRLGLTQTELAKHAQVSQSLVAKIESSQIDPTYSKAKRIFETLNSFEKKNEMTAAEMMHTRIVFLGKEDTIKGAIVKMKKYEISQLPVISAGNLAGYVSESILLESVMSKDASSPVSEIMADAPPSVPSTASREMVAQLLKHFPLVLVAEKGRYVGIITKSDLLRTVYKGG